MITSTYKNSLENYCDSIFDELTGISKQVRDLISKLERLEGKTKQQLEPEVNLLNEISHTIDWKLDIIDKTCPLAPNSSERDSESEISVRVPGF